jgi:hypothetical protein
MQNYTIPKKRCRFIKKHFYEWSFDKPDDFTPDRDAFNQLAHPAELHYLAYIYNWDDGHIVLDWILDSPLCTRSTANLLFWRAAPDYYLEFPLDNLEACESYNRDGFIVLRKIVERYNKNDFSSYQIAYDPKGNIEQIMTKDPKWTYPKGVYDKIDGVEISADE